MVLYLLLIITVIAIGAVLFLIGWAVHSILQEYRKDRVPALLYHHFAPKGKINEGQRNNYDPVYFCYDTAFAEQMSYLHKVNYTTISLDDFLAFLEGKKILPSKPILLTFDDGFMSNYLYAFPVLKKYGMTATIFVTLDPNCENFKKYASVDLPLTHEQMKEMSDYGIAIESHTMTHRYLTELELDVVRWELKESKTLLEYLFKKPVKFIAIPSGAYNRTVKQLVKDAGYQAAFCMLKGSNNRGSDPLALRRLVIGRDFTLEDFCRILSPSTACYLRLTSSLQNALLFLLGPGGLDALRDRLYGFGLGSVLTRGQLKYFVPCLGIATVFFFVLVVLILQGRF